MATRAYKSDRRQQQAEDTKQAIVQAARTVFARKGYASATMADVAREAGVAVQTIYLAFHGKADLLHAMNELLDREAGIGEVVAALKQTTDAVTAIDLSVRATRRINERCGDVLRMLFASSLEEDGLRAVWTEGLRRHDAGVAAGVSVAERAGALRLPVPEARAVLSTWTAPATWWFLVEHQGRDWDDAERFVAKHVRAALLEEAPKKKRRAAR